MKKINLDDAEWQGRFAHKKALLFNETDLDAKGSKIQIIKIEPNSEIKPHYHKIRTEVFCVLKGNGIIRLGDEEIQTKVNDFFLCKPNSVHAFRNTSNEDFIVLVMRTNDTGDSDMLWTENR